MLSSSPLSSARLLRWPRGLYFSFLLFAAGGTTVPRAAAFHRGWPFLPTRLSRAQPLVDLVTGMSPYHAVQLSTNRRSGCVSTSAANIRGEPSRSKSKRTAFTATPLGLLVLASGAAAATPAKKAVATVTTTAIPEAAITSIVLPPITRLALVCLLPTLLGYYRSEYGVSYGYGTAIAASSYLILSSIANAAGLPLFPALNQSLSLTSFQASEILASLSTTLRNLQSLLRSSLPAFHASALLFYGTRLDLFLLYRELFLARFRSMRERIEERARRQGGRWRRTPFLISCAFLYFCMISPLLVTSQVCDSMGMAFGPGLVLDFEFSSILEKILQVSVVVALFGFLLGAFGDLNKTIGKALQGEDALITGGIFRFFRHPNYTGEVIGWGSSCLSGFLAVIWKTVNGGGRFNLALWKSMAPYLLLSVMGTTGILFVLATATAGLEHRQKEKYGDMHEYREWIKKSWVGFSMDPSGKENEESGSIGESNKEAKT